MKRAAGAPAPGESDTKLSKAATEMFGDDNLDDLRQGLQLRICVMLREKCLAADYCVLGCGSENCLYRYLKPLTSH